MCSSDLEEIKKNLIQDTLGKIYLGDRVPDKRSTQKEHGSGPRLDSPSFILKVKGPDGSLITSSLQKQFHHESTHGLNYRLIYPLAENYEVYKTFMSQAGGMDSQSTDMEKGREN